MPERELTRNISHNPLSGQSRRGYRVRFLS